MQKIFQKIMSKLTFRAGTMDVTTLEREKNAVLIQQSLINQVVIHLLKTDKNYSITTYLNSHAWNRHAFTFKNEDISFYWAGKTFFFFDCL